MARCCLAWGLQPSEYQALTRTERQAFEDEVRRMNERR